ncbi:MAG: hypothetical protein AAB225_03590 [Acidobacteriota bacterium]
MGEACLAPTMGWEPLALLLLAATQPLVLVDDHLLIPPAGSRAIPIALHQRPAVIDCQFSASRGGPVMLWLVRRPDLERFHSGRPLEALLVTGYHRAGAFRHKPGPGDYAVIVDNRLDASGPAEVRLVISLLFDAEPGGPQFVPTGRKIVVVVLSLLFFLAVLWYARRRLGPVFKTRGF